ncbi:RNase H and integrase-like protein [Operophtera brumata]|uniref:RNase H and integrase-like protein n=1 Tax=Operophtera brumata TaxID=104452 RepID=A0A0L7LFF8_OPEBR|nr:RNase H and integrase-like protein [Operophtera brumata]
MFHTPPAQKRTQANSASPTRSPIRTRSVARAQQVQPAAPTEQELNSRHSHKSKSRHASHMSVKRRKLELRLAQKKAAIERDYKLQLAELELAASIADLDEEARSHRTVDSRKKVSNWMDFSIHANGQPRDDDNGLQQNATVVINPPAPFDNQQLASALKDALKVAATDAKTETISNLPVPGVFNDGDLTRRKMRRTSQPLTDLFWRRWVMLPTIFTRQKWYNKGGQMKLGDLVVMIDADTRRNLWTKEIVKRGFPRSDGRIRTVEVAFKNGVLLTRPVARLAVIPLAAD